MGNDRGRAELEADVLERVVREVREAEAAIAGYQDMLDSARIVSSVLCRARV